MELKIQHLSKSFGNLNVLDDVNLSLHSGQIYCLMGPSGSGKTTLFQILLGLVTPDKGEIHGLSGSRIGAVFQENRLCEEFTPVDNLIMVNHGYKKEDRAKAKELLARLLPEESLLRPVSTLSGGMKRRVSIARALWVPSDILLMDEPFTGLDEETKHRVIKQITESSIGKLVLISTHQKEDAALLKSTLIHL